MNTRPLRLACYLLLSLASGLTACGYETVEDASALRVSRVENRRSLPDIGLAERFAEKSTGSFGSTSAGLGDINGDEFNDFVVGAESTEWDGKRSTDGVVYIYYQNHETSDVYSSIELKEKSTTGYADSLCGGGDFNNDFLNDFIIPATSVNDGPGAAFVYYGSEDFYDTKSSADTMLTTPTLNGLGLGDSSSCRGDVNGDGYSDVLLNELSGTYSSGIFYGFAHIFYGSASGVNASDYTVLTTGVENDAFGLALSSDGDLNGDGYHDLLVGAYRASPDGNFTGAAYIYYGAEHLSDYMDYDEQLYPSDGDRWDYYGSAVASGGDLNGDGYDDFVVGSYGDSDIYYYNGAAYIYYGSLSGVQDSEQRLVPEDIEWWDGFAYNVSMLGDVDGDGYDEVGIGSSSDDAGYNAGALYVYFGSTTGIGDLHLKLTQPGTHSMHYPAGLGDLNADGYDDFIIGAPGEDDSDGAAYLYYGAPEDNDGDGVGILDDCDDFDDTIGAPQPYYLDHDGDGYGEPATETKPLCAQPKGYMTPGADCDDADAAIHPAAKDLCGDGVDADCDGQGGMEDDEDNDGLSTTQEWKYGTQPCLADSDGDGLSDGEEVLTYKTDPNTADSDYDGLSDGEEVKVYATDPNAADTDGDGLSDGEEVLTYKTDPHDADSDDDGRTDGQEIAEGTDPRVADTPQVEEDSAAPLPEQPEPSVKGCGGGCGVGEGSGGALGLMGVALVMRGGRRTRPDRQG